MLTRSCKTREFSLMAIALRNKNLAKNRSIGLLRFIFKETCKELNLKIKLFISILSWYVKFRDFIHRNYWQKPLYGLIVIKKNISIFYSISLELERFILVKTSSSFVLNLFLNILSSSLWTSCIWRCCLWTCSSL